MMAYQYRFNVGVEKPIEQWRRPGKVEWPNSLIIALPRDRILPLAEHLIRMAQRGAAEPALLSFAGQLVPDDDDDDDE